MLESDLRADIMGLEKQSHVALIYETLEDQMAAVLPFVEVGLVLGEQCYYVATEHKPKTVIEQMNSFGIDTELYQASGALVVVEAKDTYQQGGEFDPEKMIGLIESLTQSALAAGYSGFRGTGEGRWALSDHNAMQRLIEYEVKLDQAMRRLPARALCQYNLNLFPTDIIHGAFATHPKLIYKRRLRNNVFHVPQINDWSFIQKEQDLELKLEAVFGSDLGEAEGTLLL
jgi:hypothetical protein